MKRKAKPNYTIHRVFITSKARKGWINLGGNVLHVVAIKGETPYHEAPYQSGAIFWMPPYLSHNELKRVYQEVMSEIKVAPADRPKSMKALQGHLEWELNRVEQLRREGATNIQETIQRESAEKLDALRAISQSVTVKQSKELARRARLTKAHPKRHGQYREKKTNWERIWHDTRSQYVALRGDESQRIADNSIVDWFRNDYRDPRGFSNRQILKMAHSKPTMKYPAFL